MLARLLSPMINEGAEILEEGLATRDDFSRPTPLLGKLADQAKGLLDQ